MTEKIIVNIDHFDYIIIQDINSLFALEKLTKMIDAAKGDTSIHWIADGRRMIGSSALENLLLGDDTFPASLPSQKWEKNSTVTANDDIVLITNVYQDQDFIALKQAYALNPIIQLQQQQQISNKVIVTSAYVHDKCMEPSATKAASNKRRYADRHGYNFVARSTEFAQQKSRHYNWGKIDIIQKVLPNYEWLIWLDTDSIIFNQN